MARTKKGSFVKCAGTEEFLEIGVDKIYSLRLATVVSGQKGDRYVNCDVSINHETAMKVLGLLIPKRVRWNEWLPPDEEAKKKYGKDARGTTIDFNGVIE